MGFELEFAKGVFLFFIEPLVADRNHTRRNRLVCLLRCRFGNHLLSLVFVYIPG